MWYFSWVLGIGVAVSCGIINAMWYEMTDAFPQDPAKTKKRATDSRA